MKRAYSIWAIMVLVVCLVYGNQPISQAAPQAMAPLTPAQEAFLDVVAQKTWAYLHSDWATDNHLPWSWRSSQLSGGDYANPTEIGLYMLSYIAAYEMHKSWSPSLVVVETELMAVLNQLRAWQDGSQTPDPLAGANAYNDSVFFQVYWINQNPPRVGGTTATDNNHVVPSIDNAFLAASLMTIREWASVNGMTTMAQQVNNILSDMDFMLWYDNLTHRFQLGDINNPMGGGAADYYSNENRLINFVARALGQLSPAEFQASLAALTQVSGMYISPSDGSITVDKVAWDGSYFTYLAPALFIREMESQNYAVDTLETATQAQMAYATDQNYTVWGISDAFDIGLGNYVTTGAPPLAPTNSDPPEPFGHLGLVTPHASALALATTAHQSDAIANLQELASFAQIYDPNCGPLYHFAYGFKDSVMARVSDPNYRKVSCRFSALAQAYVLLAIAEHKTGFIWNYYYREPEVQLAHQEAQLSCSLGPSSPQSSRTDDLDNVAADWGAFCDQSTPRWTKANVSVLTPSTDDKALQCSMVAGSTPYAKLHCYQNLLSEPNATMFSMDFAFKFSPTPFNNVGSPSTVQAIEFSMSKWLGGKRYEFALQWENVDDGSGGSPPQWRYWKGDTLQWVAVNPPISQNLTGDLTNSRENWHSLRLEGAIVNDQVQYRSFTIDEVEHLLPVTVPSVGDSQPNHMAIAFQLDANSTAAAYDMLVDKVSFVRWSGLLTGLSPVDGATLNTLRPTLGWGVLSGAVRYQVQLGLTNPPGAIVYDSSTRTYTPCSSLKEGIWYWRVRGIDAGGHASPWTQSHQMVIQTPANAAPARNIYTTSTPTITWNNVSWATEYEIQLNTDSISVPGNALSLTLPLSDGLYCWRVRAKNGSTTGAWSPVDSFIVDSP